MKETSRARRRLGFFLKLLVSLGVLGVLLAHIDLPAFGRLWASARVSLLVGCLGLFGVAQLLSTLRWRILLEAEGVGLPLIRLLLVYLEGMFFNLFLPTLIGGDVVRGYRVYALSQKSEAALASIVVDRLTGFAAMLLIALLALLFAYPMLQDPQVVVVVGGVAMIFTVVISALASDRIKTVFFGLLDGLHLGRFTPPLRAVYDALHRYRGHGRALLLALGLSLVLQTLGILIFYGVARALNVVAPLKIFFLLVPLIIVVAMLPSLGGLGVREMGAVYFLGKVGVNPTAALGVSLGWFAVVAALSSLGGLVFLAGGQRPPVPPPAWEPGLGEETP